MWCKGSGKITDPKLVEFAELWDTSSALERIQFLKEHAPHLIDTELAEHSSRRAAQLRKGVLLGLVMLLNGQTTSDPEAWRMPEA